MMKPTDFGDSLTFSLAPAWGQHLYFFMKSLNSYEIVMKFVTDIHAAQRMNYEFGDLVI